MLRQLISICGRNLLCSVDCARLFCILIVAKRRRLASNWVWRIHFLAELRPWPIHHCRRFLCAWTNSYILYTQRTCRRRRSSNMSNELFNIIEHISHNMCDGVYIFCSHFNIFIRDSERHNIIAPLRLLSIRSIRSAPASTISFVFAECREW